MRKHLHTVLQKNEPQMLAYQVGLLKGVLFQLDVLSTRRGRQGGGESVRGSIDFQPMWDELVAGA